MSGLLDRTTGRVPYRVDTRVLANFANGLIVASLIILFLYLGRTVLEPLALAALLSLVLGPLVRRLRKFRIGRVASVIISVVLAIAMLGGLGYIIASQVMDLAAGLPKYESNLRLKARDLGGGGLTSGALERASGTLKDLQAEIAKPDQTAPESPAAAPEAKPMAVEVRERPPAPLDRIRDVISYVVSPLAGTGLVILFLVFILLQREDLRDRLLKLAGTTDLQRSTLAMDDAAKRLSRFFFIQTVLNAGFGIVIGIGLAIIGVPNPILWGILAALMRFVPFIGSWIAAFFPVVLAAAVDPGWTMALATAGLFLVLEPIAGQVVEPLVYGHNTGLSPVAVILALLFWGLLWGPLGLLVATPLTLCLVVLGKHVESLAFFDILLGDEPALAPEESFYQRMLAGDAAEASDQAERQLETETLSAYYDAVPMKALGMAQVDAARGKLSREQQHAIRSTIDEVIDDLADQGQDSPVEGKPPREGTPQGDEDAAEPLPPIVDRESLPAAWRVPFPVLCVPARSALDQAACTLLAQLLDNHGLTALVEEWRDGVVLRSAPGEAREAAIVCLSYFGSGANPIHVRYAIRRLRRSMPHAKFLAGFWLLDAEGDKAQSWKAMVGADFVATSLTEATEICVEQALEAGGKPTSAAPKESGEDTAERQPALTA